MSLSDQLPKAGAENEVGNLCREILVMSAAIALVNLVWTVFVVPRIVEIAAELDAQLSLATILQIRLMELFHRHKVLTVVVHLLWFAAGRWAAGIGDPKARRAALVCYALVLMVQALFCLAGLVPVVLAARGAI